MTASKVNIIKAAVRAPAPRISDARDDLFALLAGCDPFAGQLETVLRAPYCDIDRSSLGFTETYKHLSRIVPIDHIVLDFGCAYAPQSYYFRHHARYIGVDMLTEARFTPDNGEHHLCTIAAYIEQYAAKFRDMRTFAICNYVPSWHHDNMRLVREAFQNVFTFYPGQV